MWCSEQIRTVLMATALVLSAVAMVAAVGGTAAADQHTFEEAPDLTESADFQVNLPGERGHYPGSQNEENGSIEYFAAGADALRKELDAEEGAFFDMIIVSADWIDYSACTTDNTEAFGIDRGNNNTGTQYDEDLLQYQRENNFRDDGLDVWFYNWEDPFKNPPYFAPEDAVVAAQGEGSTGGPCLTVTSEPGWYQIQGFTNGTVADNGRDEQPSDDARQVGLKLRSNYLYVCECDNEQEAREELGPPPNEDDPGESTPTPTPTPEPQDDTDESTPTPTPTSTPTPEPQDDTSQNTPTPTPEPQDDADEGGSGGGSDGGDNGDAEASGGANATPTPGAGPGFGPVVAVLALLAGALLAHRRR